MFKKHLQHRWATFIFLGAFAKFRKATNSFVVSFRLSVRPHGTTPLLLDGFS